QCSPGGAGARRASPDRPHEPRRRPAHAHGLVRHRPPVRATRAEVLTRVLLVLNAGASSIKFSVFEVGERAAAPALLVPGEVGGRGGGPGLGGEEKGGGGVADDGLAAGATHDDALGTMLAWIDARTAGAEVIAAGHRVVHGGVRYASPVRVTPEVMQELEAL